MTKKRVLAIGIEPSLVDFSAFPGLTAELVTSYIKAQIEQLRAMGYEADSCLIDLGDTAEAVAALLKDFLPQAQREPGVKAFQIHQNVARPREFFFYEVFAGEAAFADHQQTDHFKNIIVGQAIAKLAKRDRQQFRFI